MFICVVRVVGGSTRKGQSRVERGNIFPTFTRQQQAAGRAGAGNQAAGKVVCRISQGCVSHNLAP